MNTSEQYRSEIPSQVHSSRFNDHRVTYSKYLITNTDDAVDLRCFYYFALWLIPLNSAASKGSARPGFISEGTWADDGNYYAPAD